MVKVAIAGGTGPVGRTLIEALVATKKHEIIVLTRQDGDSGIPGVRSVAVNYEDKSQLAGALAGVHTVMSFIANHLDLTAVSGKALVDACIEAGVKRFAPSEWSTGKTDGLDWYAPKEITRAYLAEVNKDKKVLEYCLFQPGLFLDYFAGSYALDKHIQPIEFHIDFENRRAIVPEGCPGSWTLTSVKDFINIVCRAVEYEGEWPVRGGINGNTVTTQEFLRIGAKLRGGKSFDVTELKEADIRSGEMNPPWRPSFPLGNSPEEKEYYANMFFKGLLISTAASSWAVTDEWNKIFSDYKFDETEEFLGRFWAGKP